MKALYVALVRLLRRLLEKSRVLPRLDRLGRRSRTALWLRSWLAIYDVRDLIALDLPWWTFEATDVVADHLSEHPGSRVFEWGSGASSVWLGRRSGRVTSIEHDAGWGDRMKGLLPANVEQLVVPPVRESAPIVASHKAGNEGLDFSEYAAAIDRFHDAFDLIVIDGRAREACLVRAVGRLAPGGLIVFDNVDRSRYRDAIAAVGEQIEVRWTRGRTPCLPYPTRTALIWRREQE